MTLYAPIFIALAMLIMLFNFFRTNDLLSKVICLNSIVSHIVLLSAFLAITQQYSYYLDLSIIYALLGGITSIALLKYFITLKQK
jgi:multisubunit Na+/H+ antiporter MnhF subunit